MANIFIAIASVDDTEIVPTIFSAMGNASNPENVYIGIPYVGTDVAAYKRLEEAVKQFAPRVTTSFTEITKKNMYSVLGVGVNRSAALKMYNDQDYFLQVDSHTIFAPRWDEELIFLHDQAKMELGKKHIVLTAYAGKYQFNSDGGRAFDSEAGVFQYPKFIPNKWFVGEGVIPAWIPEVISEEQVANSRFIPASKFNANFAFGDRWFAQNSGLEEDFVFFDEELRQTINLIELGASLVHPIVKHPLIGHLYSEDIGEDGFGKRASIGGYLKTEKNQASVLEITKDNYEKFLSNPDKAEAIRKYEHYMKLSLKFGTARTSLYIPEYFLGDDVPKEVRPWDLLNPKMKRVSDEVKEARMDICRSCKFFVSLTQQCKKCGCIMPAKTLLADAECPIHKWEAISA